MTVLYGLLRRTEDVNYISVHPADMAEELQTIAGPGSKLAKRYRVHLDFVTISEPPEDYEGRLTEMFPGRFSNLRLFALEIHDLVLTKLTRNAPLDREDVKVLAKGGHLDPNVLRERYQHEIRPRLAAPDRHDLTLKLWIDDYLAISK